MRNLPLIVAATTALAAGPGAAAVIDLGGLTTGQIPSPQTVTDPETGVDVTFSNEDDPGDGLRVSNLIGGLVGGAGICADSVGLLGIVSQCDSALTFDFSDPVDNLTFEVTGISLLSDIDVFATYDGGKEADGSDSALLSLDLLDLGGVGADLTALDEVSSVTVDASALLSTARYVGDIDFTVDGEGDDGGDGGDIAPVPLPASLPLLVAGLGGLAAFRRRRGAGKAG